MSSIDAETKRKLREMGAQPLLEALEAQHDDHVVGISFGERLQLVWSVPDKVATDIMRRVRICL
jgi:hypothetical protein